MQRPVPRQEQVWHICGKAKDPVRLGPSKQGREVEDEIRDRGPERVGPCGPLSRPWLLSEIGHHWSFKQRNVKI